MSLCRAPNKPKHAIYTSPSQSDDNIHTRQVLIATSSRWRARYFSLTIIIVSYRRLCTHGLTIYYTNETCINSFSFLLSYKAIVAMPHMWASCQHTSIGEVLRNHISRLFCPWTASVALQLSLQGRLSPHSCLCIGMKVICINMCV